MKRHKKLAIKRIIRHESGVTLVELLVAIVLISIIVTTFLSFFIQAARTNAMTDRVNEATFIAQEEMELMTYYSQNGTLETFFNEQDEIIDNSREDGLVIFRTKEPSGNLYSLRVEVKEGDKSLAQMETWVPIEYEE